MYNILIIDDEPIVIEAQVAHLRRDGSFNVSIEESGEQGVKYIEKNRNAIDLILLDIWLEDESYGLDLIPKISELTNALIVILSSSNDTAEKVQALEYGCIDYITRDELYSPKMTLLKIKNLLKAYPNSQYLFNFKGTQEVYINNKKLTLKPPYIQILKILYESSDAVDAKTLLPHTNQTRWGGEERDPALRIVADYVNVIKKAIKVVAPTYDPIEYFRPANASAYASWRFNRE